MRNGEGGARGRDNDILSVGMRGGIGVAGNGSGGGGGNRGRRDPGGPERPIPGLVLLSSVGELLERPPSSGGISSFLK